MLQHIQISNLAVVQQLSLTLPPGMTVLTGETGAGKSIILEALSLVLGERADPSLVRPGCDKAHIAVSFDISHLSGAILWLTELELNSTEQPQECIIRRVIYATGRSKAFINGQVTTTQQLRLLGEHLLQIHGQHQHQMLLKHFEQRRLLDAFGNHHPWVNQVKKAHKDWAKLAEQVRSLAKDLAGDNSRLALLRYQVEELNELAIQSHELGTLHEEQQRLEFAQQDLQQAADAFAQLFEPAGGNALLLVQQAQQNITALIDRYPQLANAKELLCSAQIQIEEVHADLQQFMQQLELDPDRLQQVEKRLETIYDMARKHKVAPENLVPHHNALVEELLYLDHGHENIDLLNEHLQHAEQAYLTVARQLSQQRANAAQTLSQEITAWLSPLGITGGQFQIELLAHEERIDPNGLETVAFGLRTNPGLPILPLHKVASGGELSRISLAIQMITAQYLNTPTLIFDEVDVGVGGKIGAVIGQALQQLGTSAQVMCVTHLPQVAAFGDHHLQVSKFQTETSTHSEIQPVTGQARIEEIARMLGGLTITSQAKEHAKYLLRQSAPAPVTP
jgi:DNA repair protein RecN (Recombination protein N)